MANLNKVMLIGRLTRDPEVRTFSSGGKVAHFGFAVNNSRKNSNTGQWEDDPVFLDVEAFNRATGRQLADQVEQYLHKGHQAYIEGHLRLDQWTAQDGQKRQKLKIVVDSIQFLERRQDVGSPDGGMREGRGGSVARGPSSSSVGGSYEPGISESELMDSGESHSDRDIPF